MQSVAEGLHKDQAEPPTSAPSDTKHQVGAATTEAGVQEQTPEQGAATGHVDIEPENTQTETPFLTDDEQQAIEQTADQQEVTTPTAAETAEARLTELEQEVAMFKEQLLRTQAEADNARKRSLRDVENAYKFATQGFAEDLLTVIDALEKAVASLREAKEDVDGCLSDGVNMCLNLFLNTIEKHNIKQLTPLGAPFDPKQHEALVMMPSTEAEPNTVIEVRQNGYILHDRLIRAAKVIVSSQQAADEG